jgi:RimJ/RimL family protein N-acetyltransferase
MSLVSDWIIETPRLGLRRLVPEDADAVSRLDWLDTDRVMRRSCAGEWPPGFLAVVLLSTGEFCGICGLLLQDLDHGRETEVGYHLSREFRGHGIATEAARGMMDHALRERGEDRVVSLIRPDNLASRRVAWKNGLRWERDVIFHGATHGMHVIHRSEYEAG